MCEILCEIICWARDILVNNTVDVLMIIVTLLIAKQSREYLKKQDEINARIEKNNRIVNFHSKLQLSKNLELIAHDGSIYNYHEEIEFKNIMRPLMPEKQKNYNKVLELITTFDNLTDFCPEDICVKKIELLSVNLKKQDIIDEQFILDLVNVDNKFKSVTTINLKQLCVPIVCLMNDEEFNKIEKLLESDTELNVKMTIKYKNFSKIQTTSIVLGKYMLDKITEDKSKKRHLVFKTNFTGLTIKEIKEIGELK